MAILKCKMCGGDLGVNNGASVVECEYCGTQQTVPSVDNEKKLTLFSRANRLRFACEFDKAAGVYESLVADFPEEAEAYWGLVLCKYGIEYVDDPATGKKVPTCHRSSFESVMDDPNLEQALENADAVARKVYREEAKAMEELRKVIIEVSGKEDPYDIFICYKETAENGQRTIDSVIAQDVYDALTEKGYRVFFSRITLEDKLGQEYEPYIFSALHSAKVMLAFGTDYKYYNAVWVKNEWRRFLQLIASGEKKTLIPCYKGIDAYDMPKEFARLQAQDMGKVGAIQDLLRGIEKIIPKAAPVTVVQERIVVGGGDGNNTIASLLDRGNMALEDGDWAKADIFFEDVLNNDSKNAQAYLGKTLAQERCRTLDAFIRKRKEAIQNARGQCLALPENTAYVDAAVDTYGVPGYTDESRIRALYNFDLSYHSDVADWEKQYRNEENYWATHKQLVRAEQFASGDVKKSLVNAKRSLLAELKARVEKAQSEENASKTNIQKHYEEHLKAADTKAKQMYENAVNERELYYQSLLQTAKASANVEELTKTAEGFVELALGDYKDSNIWAAYCRKKASEEQTKQNAIAANQKKAAAAKKKYIEIVVGALVVIAVAAIFVVTEFIIPNNKYRAAEEIVVQGQKAEAANMFAALDYKDSNERSLELRYEIAEDLVEQGKSTEAAIAFAQLHYKDSRERSMSLWNEIVVRDVIASGGWHTVGLRSDGTVVAVGKNGHHQCDVSDWSGIKLPR